jgi:hypothetical protein
MTFIIAIALLVCLLGAVLALIPNRGSTLGLIMFGVGLFYVLGAMRGHDVHFGSTELAPKLPEVTARR